MENNNLNNEQNNMMNNNQEPREIIVEQPKSNVLLITFLLLIIFALAGYIIWDKLIRKEEKEPVKGPEQEEKVEETKDAHNYYTTETVNKTVNGKETKIELKYWMEKLEITIDENGEPINDYFNDTAGYIAHADLYVNGTFVKSVGYYDVSDSINLEETYVISNLTSRSTYNKFIDKTKEINIVKGDKEYLYQKTAGGNLLVFNDAGTILFDKQIESWERGVMLDKTCPNYEKFVVQYNKDNNITNAQDNTALYYAGEDFMYYVEDLWSCNDDPIAEYKITFSNDKANLEKIADCKYEGEGACG